jgi:uncharacterized protein with LGFP repeats
MNWLQSAKGFTMRRIFNKLANGLRHNSNGKAAKPPRASLHLEALEGRELMSASPLHLAPAVLSPSASFSPIALHSASYYQNLIQARGITNDASASSGWYYYLDPIQVKYQSLGGPSGFLGNATTPEQATPYGGGLYEMFEHGAIFWSSATGAHEIHGAIETEYFNTANERGGNRAVVQQILGLPTSDEMNTPGVSGRMNTFQGGNIYWGGGGGGHAVYGGILAKYLSTGGPASYGLPNSEEQDVPAVPGERVSYFQGGRAIYWSAATGAHLVYGAIGAEYANTAFEHDAYGRVVQTLLGAPTSDEIYTPRGTGRMNRFQGGNIYWGGGGGGHAVYGGILGKYLSIGGSLSFLGLPTSEEMNVPAVPGERVSYFQGGAIYWSEATGAHLVYGGIGTEYTATANETDYYGHNVQTLLGAPTSDEMSTGTVVGRMNTFQGGAIYWGGGGGGHAVYGDIFAKYLSIGGPKRVLGLPTSEEIAIDGGRIQYFQHGAIEWTPSGGAQVV